MPMPEAPVDEYDGPVLGKHDIRSSREACAAQPITEAKAMQSLSYRYLGGFYPVSADGLIKA